MDKTNSAANTGWADFSSVSFANFETEFNSSLSTIDSSQFEQNFGKKQPTLDRNFKMMALENARVQEADTLQSEGQVSKDVSGTNNSTDAVVVPTSTVNEVADSQCSKTSGDVFCVNKESVSGEDADIM